MRPSRKVWNGFEGDKIPQLDVYIVNLPTDNNFIDDRFYEFFFHDKTQYDEKVTKMVTDYITIIAELVNLVQKEKPELVNRFFKEYLEKK